jgi:hypothetical protein
MCAQRLYRSAEVKESFEDSKGESQEEKCLFAQAIAAKIAEAGELFGEFKVLKAQARKRL